MSNEPFEEHPLLQWFWNHLPVVTVMTLTLAGFLFGFFDAAQAILDRYYKDLPAGHPYLDGIDVSIQKIESLRGEQPGEYANAQGCRR